YGEITKMSLPSRRREGVSDPASPSHIATGVQAFDLGDHASGLVFEPGALLNVVLLGILSGEVLEVQVAEIVVDGVLAFEQVVDTGLVGLEERIPFRPEDEDEDCNRQHETSYGAHQYSVSRRMRSRIAALSVS